LIIITFDRGSPSVKRSEQATADPATQQAVQAWTEAFAAAVEKFPFTQAQIAERTRLQTESWEHPLVQISHALLDHFGVVDDPFMVSSQAKDLDGNIRTTKCHCFYGTVSFNPLGIIVYENWGEGGMCAQIPENVRAFMAYPEWMEPHMPALHEVVASSIGQPTCTLDEPRPGYDWSSPAPTLSDEPSSSFTQF
jgi:hypothetical protein